MGQRHQVYVRLPAIKYQEGNPNNRPPIVIGLHHQWLYGRTAIHLLANFFRFHEAQKNEDGTLPSHSVFVGGWDAEKALAAIYSCDAREGYFHQVHPFEKKDGELKNPHLGDNNDGITVIDMVDPQKPRYCFYTLDGIESTYRPKPETVMSAREYVNCYYPSFQRRDGHDLSGEIIPELEVIEKYETLSKRELKAIFPALLSMRADA